MAQTVVLPRPFSPKIRLCRFSSTSPLALKLLKRLMFLMLTNFLSMAKWDRARRDPLQACRAIVTGSLYPDCPLRR